jgi:ABC-type transporter Mla subunit MlaD
MSALAELRKSCRKYLDDKLSAYVTLRCDELALLLDALDHRDEALRRIADAWAAYSAEAATVASAERSGAPRDYTRMDIIADQLDTAEKIAHAILKDDA